MALHPCQIVNETGNTILLKIIGSGLNANYAPDIPGVQTGLMFASPPQNVDLHRLMEGPRVVIVWKSDGSAILTTARITLSAPSTIKVSQNTATLRYAIDAQDGSGNSIVVN